MLQIAAAALVEVRSQNVVIYMRAKRRFFIFFSSLLHSYRLIFFFYLFYYALLARHYKFRLAIKSQCRKAINLMGVGPRERETIHWPFASTSGCNLVIYFCDEKGNKTQKKNNRNKGEARELCVSRFCRQWVKGSTASRFARKVQRQHSPPDIQTYV